MMKRKFLNLTVDSVAFFCFALLCSTGVLMHYLLPPGSGHSSQILGLDRHDWGSIHFWMSIAFFSVLSTHLLLHWRWITSVISGRHHREYSQLRAGLGVVGIVVILSLAFAPLLAPIETTPSQYNLRTDQTAGLQVRGSMTLNETESVTGVPAAHILTQLGLPAATSHSATLGSLKKKYHFEMQQVRAIVNQYQTQ